MESSDEYMLNKDNSRLTVLPIKDFEIIFDKKVDEINNLSSAGVKDAQ